MKNPEALLLFMASIMPFDEMVDQMKESIAAYEANPCEETKSKITMHSLMIMSKAKLDLEGGNVFSSIKEMEQHKEAHDIGSRIMGTNKEQE
jgi:hypothetical protein